MEKKKPPRSFRAWSEQNMTEAYKSVKTGNMSISAAAKKYAVPRMTLSDRISGRIKMKAKMGPSTALTEEEEISLIHYIEYMSKRGFPLSISQIIGFAYCIAKERGKGNVFKDTGPSRKWWRGFKKRHPCLGLRRPDSLDRGRAAMGSVEVMREYFQLLKETLNFNNLNDKPQQIYNCDEAALYLNKAAGQKVVVPIRQKHAHSLAVATNEHISVHCCVNAAGAAIPPMMIFTKSLPGGPYHKNGPINCSYACSDSGFMNQDLYLEWFLKTFLPNAVPQRPLLLIQDGASSHISAPLIRTALQNDVILLCLPPKTTHITQPLDVAVYRKLKIESAKVMSQAKLVKSDLWVSKKSVSGVFKIIYERSFTMSSIIEGFRKCGIYPFNPNAIDKDLLLRSCENISSTDIDLAKPNEANVDALEILSQTTPVDESMEQSVDEDGGEPSIILEDISFVVGEDGILTLGTPLNSEPAETCGNIEPPGQDCPPELALAAVESSLTPRKRKRYSECLEHNVDLPRDKLFHTWKKLITQTNQNEHSSPEIVESASVSQPGEIVPTEHPTPLKPFTAIPDGAKSLADCQQEVVSSTGKTHPLVKAGLISEDLVDVLFVPSLAKSDKKAKKKARLLTSEEVQREIEEKERKRQEQEEQKKKREEDKENKKIERALAQAKRKEQIRMRKEIREQKKAEKEKKKLERASKAKNKAVIVEATESCDFESVSSANIADTENL